MSFDIDITLSRGTRRISVAFAKGGGITALVGPSGVGKSSVLAAIAGLLRPDRGHIVIDGMTLFDAASGWSLPPERRACGVVFQDLRLFPHRTVETNLRYGERRSDPARRIMDFGETVRFLGIAPLLSRRPDTLSGGEAQRVAIGRALLAGPRCLLLDEPLASLDGTLRDGIMTVIERLRTQFALPTLLVSHSATEVARLADQVVEMTGA